MNECYLRVTFETVGQPRYLTLFVAFFFFYFSFFKNIINNSVTLSYYERTRQDRGAEGKK